MKRALGLLVGFIFIFSIWGTYQTYQYFKFEEIKYVEARFSKSFEISRNLFENNHHLVYTALFETVDELSVNIFRSTVIYNGDEIKVDKYIRLNNQTEFWNFVNLRDGHKFSLEDTKVGEQFLSNRLTTDVNQLGEISLFNSPIVLNIFPFHLSCETLPIHGSYHVELPIEITLEEFLLHFSENLTRVFEDDGIKINVSYHDFLGGKFKYGKVVYTNADTIILATMILISSFFFSYHVIARTKKISVLKMFGLSNGKIVLRMIDRITLVALFAISILSVLILFSIASYHSDFDFFRIAMLHQLVLYGTLLIFPVFSYLLILRMPIYQGLKEKNHQLFLFSLNTVLKIGISVMVLLISFSEWYDYRELRAKASSFEAWEHTHDYGMFYPLSVGNDQTWEAGFETLSVINQKLYPYLNKEGAVFINANGYTIDALKYGDSELRYITVNPNYLIDFPLYDAYNQLIVFEETDERFLVMVPEQYKEMEDFIRSFFKENRGWRITAELETIGKVEPHLYQDEITIIWTKQNQYLLSFNPKVFPDFNNLIHDPIIRVITERNSLINERSIISGQGITDPLMIRLRNSDTQETYEVMLPILQALGLEHNLRNFFSLSELIEIELHEIRLEISITIMAITSLFGVSLFLLMQNIHLSFDKNKKKYGIKRLFGYGILRTYQNYVYYLAAIWLLQLLVTMLMWQQFEVSAYIPINPTVILIFMSLEIGLSIVMLLKLEKREILSILKAGEL